MLAPNGSLDQRAVAMVEPQFEAILAQCDRLVIDLTRVNLITTPGITLLIQSAKLLSDRRGKLVVCCAAGFVQDTIRRCRLDAFLSHTASLPEALSLARA